MRSSRAASLPCHQVFRASLTALVISGVLTCLSGCGSSNQQILSHPPKPTSVIFVSQPPASLAVNAKATLLASAIYPTPSNEGSTAVTWSMTCGSAGACGAFSANDDAAAVTYTAPAAVPSGNSVTVTATSVADTTKTVSAIITIVPPIPITVAFTAPPPATLQVNSTFGLAATITNDVSANPQVKWKVTCGSSSCGSFNPTTTTSEAMTAYTAPASIPSGNSVTVTATSITDTTKSVSASILITAAAPTLADGNYVFQISGSPGSQASFITGVFTAKAGKVLSGQQDSIYFSENSDSSPSVFTATDQITGGSYSTTSDGNSEVTLQLASTATESLEGTLAPNAQGFVDAINGSPSNVSLALQTSTDIPVGGYALSLSGGDNLANPAFVSGILNIGALGKISGNGSILDAIDDQIDPGSALSVGASTVSTPDATGRFEFQLNPGSSSTLQPIYLVGYVIDSTHFRLIETGDQKDSTNFQGVLAGQATGQGANTGHFTSASLAGTSYVLAAQGTDTNGAEQLAGVTTFNADGTLTAKLNWQDPVAGSPQTPAVFTGTYSIDNIGRVTTNLADSSGSTYQFNLYLAGNGALIQSNDSNDILIGQAYQQQGTPLTAASFSGTYGLNATQFLAYNGSNAALLSPLIGSVQSTATNDSASITGFADNSGSADTLIEGTLTANANGILSGSLQGLNATTPATPKDVTLYLISDTQAILIATGDSQLTLAHLQRFQ